MTKLAIPRRGGGRYHFRRTGLQYVDLKCVIRKNLIRVQFTPDKVLYPC